MLSVFSVSIASGQQTTDLFRQLHLASHDSVRIRLYTQLAEFYYANNGIDSSLFFVKKGLSLSEKIQCPTYEADLYFLMGVNSRRKQKQKAAFNFFVKSKAIAARQRQTPQIEKAGYNIAVTYAILGNYKACVREIIKNLDYADRNKSTQRLYENYLLLSDLNMRFGNDSLSHYYLRKSWQVETANPKKKSSQRLKDLRIVIFVDSIATDLKRGNYQPAAQLLATFRKIEDSLTGRQNEFYITAYEDIVIAYLAHNYNQDALELLKYMVAYIAKEKMDMAEFLIFTVYPRITKIYLKQNKLTEAIFWHSKSRAIIDSADSLTDVTRISRKIDVLGNEAAILEKKGMYKKALEHLHTLEGLQQILNQKRRDIEFLQVSALTELEANKQKVENLNDRVKIQNLTMQNDERRRAFLQMLILLLVLLTIMIFIFLRHANHEQKLLFEQKQKIEAQSKELEDANQVKDKLFSIIGHDLRSPVADLIVTLDVANNLKPDKMQQYMLKMKDKIRYVYDVIDNLLNWSVVNLNMGQAPLKLINFKEAIGQTICLLESAAIKKNITIINQVEDNAGYANENQLQVIFRNILSNAIKFTPADGFIRIYSIYQKERIGIAIKDSGMGLDKDILHKVYTNLESRPGTTGEKGTGLGLRLSKELIEKQGGIMKIISHAGNGTVVKLYFKREG